MLLYSAPCLPPQLAGSAAAAIYARFLTACGVSKAAGKTASSALTIHHMLILPAACSVLIQQLWCSGSSMAGASY